MFYHITNRISILKITRAYENSKLKQTFQKFFWDHNIEVVSTFLENQIFLLIAPKKFVVEKKKKKKKKKKSI